MAKINRISIDQASSPNRPIPHEVNLFGDLQNLDAAASKYGYSRDQEGVIRSSFGLENDGWVVLKNPSIADTGALDPCCGIIISDSKSNLTVVGHFSDPLKNESADQKEPIISDMLHDIADKIDLNNCTVYVGGMREQTEYEEGEERWDCKESRKKVIEALKSAGIKEGSINQHFNDVVNSRGMYMQLDSRVGKLDIFIAQ